MGYIGNQQTEGFSSIPAKQDLTGATGGTLTLTHAVSSPEAIDLYINHVRQEPTSSYSIVGTTVTLNGYTVVASDDIYVVYNSLALQTTVPPDASVSTAKIIDGSVTKAKIGTTELDLATIKDSTGTNTAMTIDSSGLILQPANPKFSVQLAVNSSTADYTTTSDVPFDTIDFNVGNCVAISSSVATFTAPITGYYQFNLMVSFGSIDGAAHANTYLVIDGETAENDTYRNIEDPQGGTYHTNTTAALIYLTANQTVNPVVFIHTDTSVNIRPGTRFSGFLVG